MLFSEEIHWKLHSLGSSCLGKQNDMALGRIVMRFPTLHEFEPKRYILHTNGFVYCRFSGSALRGWRRKTSAPSEVRHRRSCFVIEFVFHHFIHFHYLFLGDSLRTRASLWRSTWTRCCWSCTASRGPSNYPALSFSRLASPRPANGWSSLCEKKEATWRTLLRLLKGN